MELKIQNKLSRGEWGGIRRENIKEYFFTFDGNVTREKTEKPMDEKKILQLSWKQIKVFHVSLKLIQMLLLGNCGKVQLAKVLTAFNFLKSFQQQKNKRFNDDNSTKNISYLYECSEMKIAVDKKKWIKQTSLNYKDKKQYRAKD